MFYLYLLFYLFVVYVELKLWRELTPVIISFSGITVIAVLHATLGRYLGFLEVDPKVFLFLLIAFVASLFAFIIFSSCRRPRQFATANDGPALYSSMFEKSNNDLTFSKSSGDGGFSNVFFHKKNVAYLFLSSVFLLLAFLAYSILNAYLSTGGISGQMYERALTYGVVGHCFALLMSCVPFLYLFYKNSPIRFVRRLCALFLIFAFVFLFMKQVKYWVLVPLVWITIINFKLNGFRINFSFLYKVLGLVAVAVALFYTVYFLQVIDGRGGTDGLDFYQLNLSIFYHLLGYLFSGLIVFSSLIEDGFFLEIIYRDIAVAFNGLSNILSSLVGKGVYEGEHVLINFYVLDDGFGKTGNVGTLWADFMLYMGVFAFPVYFLLYFAVYLLFMLSKAYFVCFIYYSGIVSFLFFSWFSSYFKLLSPYEVPILSAFIALLLVLLSNAGLSGSRSKRLH